MVSAPWGGGPDPDNNLYLNYGCGGELNYNGYCNREVDALIDRQSMETDLEKRDGNLFRVLVWGSDRREISLNRDSAPGRRQRRVSRDLGESSSWRVMHVEALRWLCQQTNQDSTLSTRLIHVYPTLFYPFSSRSG